MTAEAQAQAQAQAQEQAFQTILAQKQQAAAAAIAEENKALAQLKGVQGLEVSMQAQNAKMNELNAQKALFRQTRPGLRSMPRSGTFAAPALIFPYHKRHGKSAKQVKFFKIGKIWGVIVGSTSIDAATELR